MTAPHAQAPSSIAAVVLAAGLGTRMKSAKPKVLHEVAGRPLLAHVIGAVTAIGAARMVVVCAPGQEGVAAIARAHGASVATQERQLGTGHAVLSAAEELKDFAGDVVTLFGDLPLLLPETFRRLIAARTQASGLAVLGFRPKDPAAYGRLILGPDGMLDRSVEFRDATPAEREINLCNAGVMVCERALLFTLLREVKADNAQGEYYLPDVIGLARRRHLTCAVIETDETEVLGVNSRAELALVERHMQARLRRMALEGGATLRDPESVYFSSDTRLGRDVVVEQNVVFGPGVTVADNVMIRAFSHLEGVRVEEGAIVGPFARLRPGAEIGRNVHIGNFVEVKNAKIDEGAKANHLTYIGDAHVGAGSNIGAGTITCNYDGFDKHHTEIGANVFIGSNTALVAPVKVGEGAYVGAGSVITKDVTAEALAVERAKQAEVPGWATKFRARKRAEKAAKSKSEKKG